MNTEILDYISIINGEKKIKFNTLFFEITNRCNLKCNHCYNLSGPHCKNDIPIEKFKNIVAAFIDHGVTKILISGGEALLHSEFWDIIEFVIGQKLECGLLSNGLLLSYDVIDKLQHYNINLQISLDGACEQTNDFIRGEGTYNIILNALERIKRSGFSSKVSINTVITKYNFQEVVNIVELANKYNISAIGFSFINNIGRARENQFNISEEELYNTIKAINTLSQKNNSNVKPINITKKCRFINNTYFLSPVVDAQGELFICEFLREGIYSIGNLLEYSIDDLLEGEKFKQIMILINLRKYYIEECCECSIRYNCFAGCMAQVVKGNVFKPIYCDTNRKMLSLYLKGLIKN